LLDLTTGQGVACLLAIIGAMIDLVDCHLIGNSGSLIVYLVREALHLLGHLAALSHTLLQGLQWSLGSSLGLHCQYLHPL
jgi:hypothetical protein